MLNMPLMVVTLTGMGKGKWRQGLFIDFLRTQHIKTSIVIFKNSVTIVDENVHSHKRLAATLAILSKGQRPRSEWKS